MFIVCNVWCNSGVTLPPPPQQKKKTTEKRPNELASRDAAPLNPRLNRRNYLTS